MRFRRSKPKGPKKVHYELIDRETQTGQSVYELVERIVADHHTELIDAKIVAAWHTGWKKDVDGRVTLGKLRKASDLDRELADADFILLLNREFFLNPGVADKQRAALVDHELCHGSVRMNKTGEEPERDARDRIVYRIRRHDLEEFSEIAERYGTWKADIEDFYGALRRSKQRELPLDQAADKPSKPARPRVARGAAPAEAVQ